MPIISSGLFKFTAEKILADLRGRLALEGVKNVSFNQVQG